MKRWAVAVAVLLSLCLSGCSGIFDGSYLSVEPHQTPALKDPIKNPTATNYAQLYKALIALIENGTTESVITVSDYSNTLLDEDVRLAVDTALSEHPIAAYAVEDVTYELGKSGGRKALAMKIRYVHDRAEIKKIKHANDMDDAWRIIAKALNQCEPGVVLRIENYRDTDFVQLVENYSFDNPQLVMEVPKVGVNSYPETGQERVIEFRFVYQTSRGSLKSMQEQVKAIFTSASLYINSEAQPLEKYTQLYSFLMERYEYKLETSITPTYSLLRHGVGDSRAFATVYGAMCRQVELECQVVSGTKNGESRYWNIVKVNDVYYHVDLLAGEFRMSSDREMTGYVWDYSGYPTCGK